ncbi:hypothetical protein GGTG_08941 [Gaeumannomyces tritici R3-111a-1]|uniref:Uncharacterized protein n=1 Tax=Gaeumannomyces tritici (strain R3-111a-1) TaxID=644352 RepID=J3P601_GAET3|nr:hypothetical protein GGTG_08941 [Gaeumannomyces tritici R3-111a-1]EJT75103.1 hypothetical protein GGTG_08941 [Gaeumannomyces tritici R3-111a-1]
MASDPVLLPVQLDAFVLNPSVCGTGEPADKDARISPVSQPNYTFLRLDNFLLQPDVQSHATLHSTAPAALNPRLTDLGARPPKPLRHRHGVYLHWTLPRCYRAGVVSSGDAVPAERARDDRRRRGLDVPAESETPLSSSPEFTEPPTRWLVVRQIDVDSIKPEAARAAFKDKEYQGWVIESDYLWSLDKIPLDMDLQTDMAPFVVGQPGPDVRIEQQAEVFIGRKYSLEEWKGAAAENPQSKPPNISLLRSSNQFFADFQMHNANVFSMLDNFQYAAADPKAKTEAKYLDSAVANYYLIGWHWKADVDPLWRSGRNGTHAQSMETLFMKMMGKAPGDGWLDDKSQLRLVCHGAMYNVIWDHTKKPSSVPADRFSQRLRDQTVPAVSVGTTPMDALVSYCSARKGSDGDSHEVQKMEEDILAIYSLLHARDDGVEAQREAKDSIYNWAYSRGQGGTRFHFAGEDAQGQPLKPSPDAVVKLRLLNQAQALLDACSRALMQYRWDVFSLWWKYVSDVSNKKDGVQNLKFKRDTEAATTKIAELEKRIKVLAGDVDKLKADSDLSNAKPGSEPFFYRARDPTVLVGGVESGWATDFLDKVNVRVPKAAVTYQAEWGLPPGLKALVALVRTKLPSDIASAGEALLSEFHALRSSLDEPLPEGKEYPQFHDQKTSDKRWRDRWDRQPWFPLYAEWEAEYTHVPWENWRLDEQTARLSANKTVRYGITTPSGKPLWEELKGRLDTRVLSGRVLILPQPSFSLRAKVTQLFDSTPASVLDKYLPEADRTALLANIDQLAYLSSPLAGFTDGLLTLSQGTHLKPENKTVNSAGAESSNAILAAVFEDAGFSASAINRIQNNSAVTPYAARTRFVDNGYSPFKPVTHGQFRFLKFNIIDKFGQALMAIDPEPKATGPDPMYPCISDFYEPQLVVSEGKDNANTVLKERPGLCEFMQLPPSINQNARFNATFVRRVRDDPPELRIPLNVPGGPSAWRPASEWENPIWGWIITNYADYGIQLFRTDGTFYREVRFGGPLGALAAPKWIPFAPVPKSDPNTSQLDLLAERLTDVTYLTGFWHMITTAQDALPPAPTAYAQFLNSIVGKPLALVNMGWSLELDGPPLVTQSTNASVNKPEVMLTAPQPDDKSKRYSFQVRLGNRESEHDGLVGYFDVTAASDNIKDAFDMGYINTFFAPDPRRDEKPLLPLKRLNSDTYPTFTPYWQAPFPTAPPYDPASLVSAQTYDDQRNRRMAVYGAIVDPFTPVHAYSSLLPPQTLQLPGWTWQAALNNMTAFFHAGPMVLVDDVGGYNGEPLTAENWRKVPARNVALPGLGAGEWNWLQPFDLVTEELLKAGSDTVEVDDGDVDVDVDDGVAPVFNAYGIEKKGNLNKPGFEKGPYTAVEGFLQLRNPLMMPKPEKGV